MAISDSSPNAIVYVHSATCSGEVDTRLSLPTISPLRLRPSSAISAVKATRTTAAVR